MIDVASGPRLGCVVAFDVQEGLGVVRTADGVELPFHCVAIVDGTRQIDVGRKVRFVVRPGLPGLWEAAFVDPAATEPSQPAS